MQEFYNKVQAVFDDIKQPVPEFTYDEKTKEYFSLDGYIKDNVPYSVLVKTNNSVVYGIVEGSKFYEEGFLGYLL